MTRRTPSRGRRRRLAARVEEARRNVRQRRRVADRETRDDQRINRLQQRVAELRNSLRIAERALEQEHFGLDETRTAAVERREELRRRLRRARARRRIAERRAEARSSEPRRASRQRPEPRRLTRREAEYDKKYPPVVRRKSDGKIMIREDLPMWRRQAFYNKLRKAGLLDE